MIGDSQVVLQPQSFGRQTRLLCQTIIRSLTLGQDVELETRKVSSQYCAVTSSGLFEVVNEPISGQGGVPLRGSFGSGENSVKHSRTAQKPSSVSD